MKDLAKIKVGKIVANLFKTSTVLMTATSISAVGEAACRRREVRWKHFQRISILVNHN